MSSATQNQVKFIDYRHAIGMLVVAGLKVVWHNHQIIDTRTGEGVCTMYRDGAIFKVKEEVIVDYILDNN